MIGCDTVEVVSSLSPSVLAEQATANSEATTANASPFIFIMALPPSITISSGKTRSFGGAQGTPRPLVDHALSEAQTIPMRR